jgi:glutathione S-transferase
MIVKPRLVPFAPEYREDRGTEPATIAAKTTQESVTPCRSIMENKWLPSAEFNLVDCAYCPILNVIEKTGFSFAGFPKIKAYLDAVRSRRAWQETPKLPGL